MGIIRAAISSVGGTLADQWLEFIQADNMDSGTIMAAGVPVRRGDRRGQNTKGSKDVISNGSVILVEPNQFMIFMDGGKIADYSADPGYYTVDRSAAPSLFSGDFALPVEDALRRISFGGIAPHVQRVYYINTQEIRDIPFGTPNPINYFDNFYNAELNLRCHGFFSIRIVDPLKFFSEVVGRSDERVRMDDLQKLYLSEMLTALQTAIGRMSVDGIRISYLNSRTAELARYLSQVLDAEWTESRGMVIESVGISSLTYDGRSQELINMRNQGAMLSDPSIREGYVQGEVARGIGAAGSNPAGAGVGFMGVQMGMNAGGFMASASAGNQNEIARQQQQQQEEQNTWQCECGHRNTGRFCSECGKPRPLSGRWVCPKCAAINTGKFCSECGEKQL